MDFAEDVLDAATRPDVALPMTEAVVVRRKIVEMLPEAETIERVPLRTGSVVIAVDVPTNG